MNTLWYAIPVLAVALVTLVIIEIVIGPAGLSLQEVLSAFQQPGTPGAAIVWNLRVPRTIYGILVGAGLAVSGLALQGLFRNPLAEPFTLGISGGAALGAVLMITLGIHFGSVAISLASFLGALCVCVVVYLLAKRTLFSPTAMILGGVILGYLAQSGVLLAFSLAPSHRSHGALMWLMGDLGSASPDLLLPTGILAGIGFCFLAGHTRGLNLLSMGEEKASSLGLNVPHLRANVFVWSSLIAGVCVAAVGIVGFVGLIIPNAVRRFYGGDHRILFPLSALLGASFVLGCDVLARALISPIELPLGVITGFVGSIVFLWIFASRKRV